LFARFAQNSSGEWGLQITGIGDAPLEGPVETILVNDELTAWGGLADDPFFFDQAIAIQLPITSIQSNGSALQTWTTTSNI